MINYIYIYLYTHQRRAALLSLVVLGEAAGAARRLQGSADDEPRPGVTRILFGSCSKVIVAIFYPSSQ